MQETPRNRFRLSPFTGALAVGAAVVALAGLSGERPTRPWEPAARARVPAPPVRRVAYHPKPETIQPGELVAIRGFEAPQPTIRVALSDALQDGALAVTSASGLLVTDPVTHRLIAQAPGNTPYTVSLAPHGRALSGANGKDLPSPRVRIQAISPDSPMETGKRSFQGALEVSLGEAGLDVMNEVSQEDYITGVVAGEAARSFPMEALKAQAVAARTYALASLGNRGPDVDVVDTVADQVYTGAGVAWPDVKAAVAATAGEVLSHRGRPIIAYFSADCGGATRNRSAAGFGSDLAYLRAVRDVDANGRDYCAASPSHTWTRAIPAETVRQSLNAALDPDLIELTDIRLPRVYSDGRVGLVTVAGRTEPAPRAASAEPVAVAAAPAPAGEPVPGGGEAVPAVEAPAPETPAAAEAGSEAPSGSEPDAAPPAEGDGTAEPQAPAPEPVEPEPTEVSHTLSAWEFRTALGVDILRSQRFAVSRAEDGGWLFSGRGYGHGVGLCQWGACGRALAGETYRSILKHYYTGVSLEKAPARAGILEGIAKDTDGTPFAHAVVTLAGTNRQAMTDAAGRFRFEDMPAGAWDVVVTPQDAPALMSFAWRVRPGETARSVIKPVAS